MHKHNKLLLSVLVVFIAALLGAGSAAAGDKPFERFGDHQVFFSVYNSSFIKPDIARIYNITRGKDRALINIAVVKDGVQGGIPAQISGTATNLMQQQRKLEFSEIQEQDAVYYLASVRFTNEEVLNFAIDVKMPGNRRPYQLKFTKTLYVDN
ncbi:DUF4426 domain-containing protein [Exilibacterium tricleocarpae]|uniref:DUF4426 domain-containing protein n=1 Tax=Exilibacterium tricleocarpae TaxID=2591008 RepID=A0A545SXC9_9GAMM|nr:DUF4426 domain-containing protein [Exilibacterium tricleocarpae]TQV69621.1 DUF4426 domain-containing protein [Exilibacterium tricleocarpae]